MINKNNIIKKILVYFFAILILYFGLYCFFDSVPDGMTIEISMRQSVDNNIQLHYKQNPYDTRNLRLEQRLNASEDFQTVKFALDQNYIYSLDLALNNTGNETSNVGIQKITAKTLFSKRTFDSFSDFNASYETNQNDRFTIVDGFVFSPFQLTTKIKIVSLCISIFLVFLFRKFISQFCYNTKLNNDTFKIALFTSTLFFIFTSNFITINKKFDYLWNRAMPEKPKLTSYTEVVDTSFMRNIESYLKKQFSYNYQLTEDYFAFNRLLQKNNFENKYITKYNDEDLILKKSVMDNYSLDYNIENVSRMNEFLQEKDIPYLFFIMPDKELLFDDKFPTYMDNQSPEIQAHFVDNLNKNNVKTYPLADLIYTETIENGINSHYRTDHHFTTQTTFIAYQSILDRLIENNIEVVQNNDTTYETLTYKDKFAGSDARSIAYGYRYNQVKDDFTIIYPVNSSNYTIVGVFDDFNLSGDFRETLNYTYFYSLNEYVDVYQVYHNYYGNKKVINNTLETDNTIVILGDSYARPIAKFLADNFKNVITLDQCDYNTNQILTFLETNSDNIDAVINFSNVSTLSDTKLFDYFK